jgi:outer membrane protein TolC
MIKYLLVFIIFTVGMVDAQDNVLDTYIKIGLENNLSLRQQQFSLEQSMEALNEARGLFFPSIDIGARYSRAGGGREFVIPVGDLVNPVYQTLNQLLGVHGQPPLFPENIPDQKVQFLREEEHDTRVRLVQPLFQPAIWSNYSLKSELNDIEDLKTTIFKRNLVAEIKRAYYNYLKATQVVELYQKIEEVQTENLRVSQSLYAAGTATQDVVFRAQAELGGTEQEKLHVENLQRQSKSYFNFIINRPLQEEITTISDHKNLLLNIPDLELAREHAFAHREELRQIKSAISAADKSAAIVKSRYYPGLNAVLDYGFQGEKYKFSTDNDYWMASLVLDWNLFNGFQDKAKLQQAHLEGKKLSTQENELRNLIELEVERIYDNLTVAQKTIEVNQRRVESSLASFNIISKKFEEGAAAQVEYLDAQTTLTNAAITEIISRYDYYIVYADFERIVALYNFQAPD